MLRAVRGGQDSGSSQKSGCSKVSGGESGGLAMLLWRDDEED